MFCKWCGQKIIDNGIPCPACGREQPPLENGNGFWDLCGDKMDLQLQSVATSGEMKSTAEQPDNLEGQHNKKGGILHKVTIFASLMLSLVAIGGFIIILSQMNRYHSELTSLNSDFSKFRQATKDNFYEIENRNIVQTENTTNSSNDVDYSDDMGDGDIEEDTTVSQLSTEQIPIEETESESSLNSDIVANAEKDELMIERFRVSDERTWIYRATGELLDKNKNKLYWQVFNDFENSWINVAEDVPYISTNNEDSIYRVICSVRDRNEVSLSDIDELEESDFSECIMKQRIDESDELLFSVIGTQLSSEEYSYVWQFRNEDETWSSLHSLPICLVPMEDLKQYRLVIFKENKYCVEYSENGEDD